MKAKGRMGEAVAMLDATDELADSSVKTIAFISDVAGVFDIGAVEAMLKGVEEELTPRGDVEEELNGDVEGEITLEDDVVGAKLDDGMGVATLVGIEDAEDFDIPTIADKGISVWNEVPVIVITEVPSSTTACAISAILTIGVDVGDVDGNDIDTDADEDNEGSAGAAQELCIDRAKKRREEAIMVDDGGFW